MEQWPAATWWGKWGQQLKIKASVNLKSIIFKGICRELEGCLAEEGRTQKFTAISKHMCGNMCENMCEKK